jgi:hypothetical protein
MDGRTAAARGIAWEDRNAGMGEDREQKLKVSKVDYILYIIALSFSRQPRLSRVRFRPSTDSATALSTQYINHDERTGFAFLSESRD